MEQNGSRIISSYQNKDIFFHYSFDYRNPSENYELHCHPFYEIYYFITGTAGYLVEGKRYQPTPHSLLLLPSGIFHGIRIEKPGEYSRFSVHFNESILPPEYRSILLSPFRMRDGVGDIYYENVQKYRLLSYFENLSDSSKMPEEYVNMSLSISVQSLLSQILYISSCSQGVGPHEHISDQMSSLLHYLNQNLAESLSLDDLSAKFYISKHHMNKLFRRATGTTIGEYITIKRITLAQQLITQGYPATQVYTNAGFSDYSTFYRAYHKVTGHSPREDKKT